MLNEDEIKIGDRIKQIRKETNFNQEYVSTKLGISRSAYANYENNRREPDIETIKKIADILQVHTVKMFVDDEKYMLFERYALKRYVESSDYIDVLENSNDKKILIRAITMFNKNISNDIIYIDESYRDELVDELTKRFESDYITLIELYKFKSMIRKITT